MQGIVKADDVASWYNKLDENDKQDVLVQLWGLARQAKVLEEDVLKASELAKLKITHNPVKILLRSSIPFHKEGIILEN